MGRNPNGQQRDMTGRQLRRLFVTNAAFSSEKLVHIRVDLTQGPT
jgi:hypothetical protein